MFTLGGHNLALNLLLLLFSLASPAFGNLSWNNTACSMFQTCMHRWNLGTRITVVQFVSFFQSMYRQCCVLSSYFTLHILTHYTWVIFRHPSLYQTRPTPVKHFKNSVMASEKGPYTCTCANLADESKD